MKSVAIFLPDWVGDVVMATPTLRALRKRFSPETQLIGVVRPYVAEVLNGVDWLDECLYYDPRAKDPKLGSWNLLRELRSRRLDTVVLLTNSLRTGALAWLSGARRRVGYARDLRGWLLNDRLTPPAERWQFTPVSAVDYYLEIAYRLECPVESRKLELGTTAADDQAAESLWQSLKLPADRRVVALHMAGGHAGKATAKAWPVENFTALARRIATQLDWQVLALCGPNERDVASQVERGADHPLVKSLAQQDVGLGLTKAILKRVGVLTTTDSGPRHIATAFDIPVVALFGATDPRWSETHHPLAINIFNKTDCGPCAERHCPLGHHRCMRDISVDRVFEAVKLAIHNATSPFKIRAA